MPRFEPRSALGESLGLWVDEPALYDTVGVNGSAVQGLGDTLLRDIARELVETARSNVTIDWRMRKIFALISIAW